MIDCLGQLGPLRQVPLSGVRLLPGRAADAFNANARYLETLDNDMLLFCYRFFACRRYPGTPPGGWEAPLNPNRGSILGHWLSGVARTLASGGPSSLRDKADAIVADLRLSQLAHGDGFVQAWGPERVAVMEGKRGGDADWSVITAPYYHLHKLLAGLLDMRGLVGSDEALVVARDLGGWIDRRCAALADDELQRILAREHGGIEEALLNLGVATGDSRFVELAGRFEHHALTDPLDRGEDPLTGLHANTQLPKLVGEARRFDLTGNERSRRVVCRFWDLVAGGRTYATGGSSSREHWGLPGHLAETLGPQTQESCTTYNWLKLTRHLLCWTGAAQHGDALERALFNGIIPAQDPGTGQFIYFLPITRGGGRLVWGTPTDSFWCCYGTMMEQFGAPAEYAYFEADHLLVVNLFIPSVVEWHGLRVEQQTSYPSSPDVSLRLAAPAPTRFRLALRVPAWTDTRSWAIRLNNEPVLTPARAGSYCVIDRVWHGGDTVDLHVPLPVWSEPLPGAPDTAAILHGPSVLAGLVEEPLERLVAPADLVACSDHPGEWRLDQSGQAPVAFVPLDRIGGAAYGVYFRIGPTG